MLQRLKNKIKKNDAYGEELRLVSSKAQSIDANIPLNENDVDESNESPQPLEKGRVTVNVLDSAAPSDPTVKSHESLSTATIPAEPAQVDGVRIIYEKEVDTNILADIVFVHGLTGGSDKTWLDKRSGVYWPLDLLSKDMPDTRILAFDYDADVIHLVGAVSQNTLRGHAEALLGDLATLRTASNAIRRPVIFIVHSLGGLVVKKALCVANTSHESHLKLIGECTKAIAFLGTPHRGSSKASLGFTVANVLKSTGKRVNVDIVNVLKPDNEILTETEDSFGVWLRSRPEFNIACFYEELELSGVGKVVPKDSAKIVGYTQIPIHANHKDMARFKSDSDSGYIRLLGELQRWFNQIAAGSVVVRDRTELERAALKSLAFPEMNFRSQDINDATDKTCGWIFEHHAYQDWLNQHQSLLWIKGKPGSGKSTIMKHILQSLEAKRGSSRYVTLSFFFHGRGSMIQKTPLGLYRSVLHQILDSAPSLLTEFSKDPFGNKEDKVGKYGEDWEWGESELKNLLKHYLATAANEVYLRLFVDALDECGANTARSLVVFFQDLMGKLPNTAALQVIFSCRHYPLLSIRGSLELSMENENSQDLEYYIQVELERYIEDQGVCDELKAIIASKADGIFQWVVLMVSTVTELYLAGLRVSKIRDAVENKPTHLHDLYENLLTSVDKSKRPKLMQIVQWVMFAQEPLDFGELRRAIAVQSNLDSESLQHCMQSVDCETDEELTRMIRDLSCGLIEVVWIQPPVMAGTSFNPTPKIQFIHQSVIDFITESGFKILDETIRTRTEFLGQSEHILSRTCIKYINLFTKSCDDHHLSPSQSFDNWISLMSTLTDPLNYEYPSDLLSYASRFWIHHARSAEREEVDQKNMLKFWGWPTPRLIDAWVQYYVRYFYGEDLVIQATTGMDLFHVAAKHGLMSMFQAILDHIDNQKVPYSADYEGQCRRAPLSFAAEAGRETIIKTLLKRADVNINRRPPRRRAPVYDAAVHGDMRTVHLFLAQDGIDVNTTFNGKTMLFWAYNTGHWELAAKLLERDDTEVNIRYKGKSLLVAAINERNHRFVRLMLARKDIDVNALEPKGFTTLPLCRAVCDGDLAIIKMLLDRPDIEINKKDKRDRSAFWWTETYRPGPEKEAVQKLLLEHGAEATTISETEQDLLESVRPVRYP